LPTIAKTASRLLRVPASLLAPVEWRHVFAGGGDGELRPAIPPGSTPDAQQGLRVGGSRARRTRAQIDEGGEAAARKPALPSMADRESRDLEEPAWSA
jgi:hypothetical protein